MSRPFLRIEPSGQACGSAVLLTDRVVRGLPAGGTLRDRAVRGLRVQRSESRGVTGFIYRYRSPVDGKVRQVKLGVFGAQYGVVEARADAQRLAA
jgi:hypothetical protein